MHRLVKEVLPEFALELRTLLIEANRADLAAKVDGLPYFQSCGCGDGSCASFYTADKPDGAYGAGHSNLMLTPQVGMVILDLVDDDIRFLEVLGRPDVHQALSAKSL